ncbi:MAG: MutS-related protein [Acidimicrobiales bacterium]
MKAHLLYANDDFDFEADLPANHEDLIQDLELPTLLEAMALDDKFIFDVSKRVLLASLERPDAITYRQQVLADCVAQPAVIRELYAIVVAALGDRRGIWGFSSQYPASVLAGSINQLEAAFIRLKALRKVADEHADKFRSDGLTNLFDSLQHDLDDAYLETISYHLKQLRFRKGKLISAELGPDNSGIRFVLRSSGEGKRKWRSRLGVGPRSSYSFTIPPRDDAGHEALSDMTSRAVNLVANAAGQSADHILSYFTTLRAELGFYVGCLNLWDQLAGKGESPSFPEPSSWEAAKLSCTDLRDVCLRLRSDQAVTGNDVDADGKALVVITGANSGGKSTFLRSVGLAQIMMQSGMFVTAQAYNASVCSGVFTHFIREEDATMTSGRLDEELRRMSTIADQIRPHCLMLFNESFAATNEREGSEIGRQVVRALLEAEIKVLFVTHQFDFAESFYHQQADSTLFLRADRRIDGEPNYKLVVAEPLPTSFGEDLYYRLGGWLGEDQPSRPAAVVQAHPLLRSDQP